MADEITKSPPKEIVKSLFEDLKRYVPSMAKTSAERDIGQATKDAERALQVAMRIISKEPKLQECSKDSILACLTVAVELGLDLSPTLGKFFFVPRAKGNAMECTYQIGYKGLIELVQRNPQISFFDAQVVRLGDSFEVSLGDRPFITHKPDYLSLKEGEVVASYAVARVRGEEYPHIELISGARLREAQAKAAQGSPWRTNFAAMSRKTPIRALANRLPMLSKIAQALAEEDPEEFQHLVVQTQPGQERPKSANEALSQAIG